MLSLVMLLCFLPSSVLAQIGEALNSEENEALSDLSVSDGESAPYVLGEVEDRRTENTKTFRMSDGSYIVADYGKRIHFEDENGNLQDYDNSLAVSEIMTLDADDFAGADNAESDVYVKLANNSNSNNLLKIQKDDYKISLHLVGADKSKALEIHTPEAEPVGNDIDSATTLHKFSSGAIYRDILPSVDLEYLIYGGTVKENIIVKEQLDSYNFTFELKLEGINPVLQPDGSIALNSATGTETVMVIPKGIMYDANGASSNAVEYAIAHKNGNKYTLTVTASEEWINANERAFPVTVDPTFTPADNGANTEDIGINSSGVVSDYKARSIRVGYTGSVLDKMLIKASELPELPDSAVIVDAQLKLMKSSVTLATTVAVYTVSEDWSSATLTSSTIPENSTTVIDYHTINATSAMSEYRFDITKAAQYWYDNGKNTGVLLAPLSSGGNGYVNFKSSDSSNKPVITISYRDTKGIESQWSFSTQSAGSAGVGYINGFNGNLVFAHADMTTEGSVIPITVSHVYNSFQSDMEFTSGNDVNSPLTADYSNMKVGKGWKLSVQQTVKEVNIDNIPYIVYNDSDGTEHYFVEFNGEYVDEDGFGLTLAVSGSGENKEYRIENEYGNSYIFNSEGKIRHIVDVHGNKKRFTYNENGALYAIYYEPVESALIHQLVFAYNAEGALYRITNAYNQNDYVQFLYSESISGTPSVNDSGYLREIRYYNGSSLLNTVYYEYHEYTEDYANEGKNGSLKSARDGDTGYKVEYKYDKYEGRFRVRLAEESVGGTLGQRVGFEYDDKLFCVRTSGNDDSYGSTDDIFTYTLFDDFAQPICSYSKFNGDPEVLGTSYADYMPYESASETNYKLKTASVKGITKNNLLYNPNCEPSSEWIKMAEGDGYSASYTTAESYFGTGSLKLSSTDGGTGYASYTDSIYLTAGTYTLSAYVKLVNVQSTNGGFYLRCVNSGDYKTGTTNTAIDNGWQRVSHTFNIASAGEYDVVFSLDNAPGTAYVDCVQLEKGETLSDFNLVENGGFDSARKWSGSYTVANGSAVLSGLPTAQKRITQTIALSTPINTTFMLSGWAKADSASLATAGWDSANGIDPKSNRKFGVIAKLTYSDNSTDEFELSFNPDNTQKQFASTAIVPKKTDSSLTVTSIEITAAYDYNVNTAQFDDITLTIEPAQTYAYDEEGNLSTATDANGNDSVMHYHENGIDLTDYTAITGESFDYTYDSKHQVITASKTVGNTTQTANYTYDNYGNTTGVELSAGGNLKITSSASYTEYGNYISQTVNELGKVTKYNYDPVTKLLAYIENANSVQTAYIYDNRDRTSKIYLDSDKDGIPDTAEPQVAYLYANNRLSGIDTATTDYTLTYDIWGNVLSIKAGNYTLATYEYAANNGKLKKLTYGNGDYEEYVYDELERLVQTKLNGVTEYTVKYDANGRLYSLTENDSTHIYEYDSLDRLVRAWQKDANGNITVAVENSYDDLGRAKGSTYVVDDRTMSYEVNYKANSNLVNYVLMPTAGLQSSISYTYDEFERVTKKQNSFSSALNFYEQYGYYNYTDADNVQHTTSLVSTVTFGGNTTNAPSVVYSYTYDNLGNITQIRKDGVIINEYTYDSLGQLTCEEDAVAGKTYIYYYDKSGNITQKDSYPFAEGATMGDYISYIASQKETVGTYIYNNSTWGDLLGVYNGKIILYDAIGNPINWHNATGLTWEARELQSISLSGGSSVSYSHNSNGIRTQKVYNNAANQSTAVHFYTLDGANIIRERVVATAGSVPTYDLYYLYDESGSVAGLIYNNQHYYFQKNLQGDVIRILNNYGTVVVEYSYDAWGKVISTTGSMASTLGQYNPFRYRSYYYDTETGFYYLQSRYYDPTVGRFLNADGIIGANGGIEGYNMFAYCNNNPINSTDINGNEKTDMKGEYDFEYGTVTIDLEAYGNSAKPMANAIKVENQTITITLPNGVTVTFVINKNNISVSPYVYGILQQQGYNVYCGIVNGEIQCGIMSYDTGASRVTFKGTYKPNVVDNDAHEDGDSNNDEDRNYSDNIPNAYSGHYEGNSNPGSISPALADMDMQRMCGGGINKDMFPVIEFVFK